MWSHPSSQLVENPISIEEDVVLCDMQGLYKTFQGLDFLIGSATKFQCQWFGDHFFGAHEHKPIISYVNHNRYI